MNKNNIFKLLFSLFFITYGACNTKSARVTEKPPRMTPTIPPEQVQISAEAAILQHLFLQSGVYGSQVPGWDLNQYCSWPGVTCDQGWVTELHLSEIDFQGNIPPELGNLTYLQILDLGFNRLTGSIPAELGNLTYLDSLFLDDNFLTGSIPPELGNLTYLTMLDLSDNYLVDVIPPELDNLISIQTFLIDENCLTSYELPEGLLLATQAADYPLHYAGSSRANFDECSP